jgi:hypothetical protein
LTEFSKNVNVDAMATGLWMEAGDIGSSDSIGVVGCDAERTRCISTGRTTGPLAKAESA